jgi:hypothetical protein
MSRTRSGFAHPSVFSGWIHSHRSTQIFTDLGNSLSVLICVHLWQSWPRFRFIGRMPTLL